MDLHAAAGLANAHVKAHRSAQTVEGFLMELQLASSAREFFTDERFGGEQDARDADGRHIQLHEQREKLKQRRGHLVTLRTAWFGLTALSLLVAPIALLYLSEQAAVFAVGYGMLFYVLFLIARQRSREIAEEMLDIDNEIDLLTIQDGSEERRAQKLFQLHSIQLKQYYDQALKQGSYIFWVGLVCIFLGFGIIAATFWLLQREPSVGSSEQIIIGALGSVGGVLANFIALIYLRMHSETVQSTTKFHNRLVLTHHLHFGNFLVAKITNQGLRESTLGSIASALALAHGPGDVETAEPELAGMRAAGQTTATGESAMSDQETRGSSNGDTGG
jgi:hypothetical protein